MLASLAMTVLDSTLVNVALPVIATQMSISPALSVTIVTVYQLIIVMLLLPLSALGDRYSYRKVFICGIIIFTIASVLCACADTFIRIIAARTLQGFGAACIMGVNIAITRIIYPPEKIGRGLALNAMVIAVTTAAGPSLAGAILSIASWQWLFIINIPLGIASFILARKNIPQNPAQKHTKAHFDYIGAAQNAIVFGLIFTALTMISRSHSIVIPTAMLILGTTIAFFYIRRQRKISDPILPVDLLKIKLYSMSLITSICSFIAQSAVFIALPFLLLDRYNFSTITTGLLLTPWPIATTLISPVAARFIERHNPGKTAAAGMAVFLCGCLILSAMPQEQPNPLQIILPMIICGIGYGLYQTPNNVVMVIATPVRRAGGAGGLQSSARLVGQTSGAVLATIMFSIFSSSRSGINACFICAAAFGLIAAVLSYSRTAYMPPK